MTGENLTDHPLAVAWGGTVVSHVIGKCYFFLGAAFPPVLTLSAVSRCLEGYPFDVAHVAGWLLFLTQGKDADPAVELNDPNATPSQRVRGKVMGLGGLFGLLFKVVGGFSGGVARIGGWLALAALLTDDE